MQKLFKVLGLLSLVIMLGACEGEPTFDGSSKEASDKSVKSMIKGMPKEKQKKLMESIAGIYIYAAMQGEKEGKSTEEAYAPINRKLDGMTADEIIEHAKQIEQ